jgi:hypothetical protein
LQEEVTEGEISKERALEIAESRAAQKLGAHQQETASAQDQQKEAVNQAIDGLRDLGARLSKTDPLFGSKVELLKPVIDAVTESGTDPSRWVGIVENAYKKIVVPTGAVAPSVPDTIRPGGSSAAADLAKEPGTILEAVEMSLRQGG